MHFYLMATVIGYYFMLAVCNNDVSILHRYQDITNSTAYASANDLEQ